MITTSSQKYYLFFTDFVTVSLAYIVFFILRVQTGWFDIIYMPDFLLPMLVIFFYWFVIFTVVGLYKSWFALSRFDEASKIFKASFVGIFALFFIIFLDDYSTGVNYDSRMFIVLYWGLFFTFVTGGRLVIRSIQRHLLVKGFGRRNAIVVGMNEKGKQIYDDITSHKALGLDVVGFVTVNGAGETEYKEVKLLGGHNEIKEIIKNNNISEVVIALEKHDEDLLIKLISDVENANVGLKIVPDLYEILSGQARTAQLYGFPLIDIHPVLMPEWEMSLKRVLDIIISMFLLILASPVIIIATIAIKLNSKGPAFYLQERCGINGRLFRIIKFRSMYVDAEKHTGPVWSVKDDPRVTPVGKIIRKIRIDELPQMINVLKGEMSLIGPRPERPFFVEKLAEEIPYYKRRLRVKPGITGWAQVKHKYDESVEDVKMKLKYDLFYIENMSIRMDLKILLRTVFVVIFGKGHFD